MGLLSPRRKVRKEMSMDIPSPVRERTREDLENDIMDYMGRLYLSPEDVEKLYIAEFELEQLDMNSGIPPCEK